jgi:hypothetical protein
MSLCREQVYDRDTSPGETFLRSSDKSTRHPATLRLPAPDVSLLFTFRWFRALMRIE